MDTSLISVLFLAVVVIIALSVFFTFVPVMLWISALASGVRIGIITLVAMRLRRVLPSRIVNPMIKATKAGIEL
ncbi:flotillin-like FloA family protein, partial [Escherichia coli]